MVVGCGRLCQLNPGMPRTPTRKKIRLIADILVDLSISLRSWKSSRKSSCKVKGTGSERDGTVVRGKSRYAGDTSR